MPTPIATIVPAAAPTSSKDIWSRFLQELAGKPALSWVERSLTFLRADDRIVHLATRPGSRDVRSFVQDRHREQLAELFSKVLGRPVKVEVQAPADAPASSPLPSVPTPTVRPSQQALNLPLVSQVMREFDTTLAGVRDEQPASEGDQASPPPAATPAGGIPFVPPPMHEDEDEIDVDV